MISEEKKHFYFTVLLLFLSKGNHSELKAAIQLLLTLAGTCPKKNKDLPVGYQEPDLPLVDVKNKVNN